MGDSHGQGFSVTPGLPSLRDTHQVCVCFPRAHRLSWASLWNVRTQCPSQEPWVYQQQQPCFFSKWKSFSNPGEPAGALDGQPQPLTLGEPHPALGFRFCAVQQAAGDGNACSSYPAPQLSSVTTSHLLPIQTVSEGWPHVPHAWKMGVRSTCSQSHCPSSACSDGPKDGDVTWVRHSELWVFMEPWGRRNPSLWNGSWVGGCHPGVVRGPGCSERDCAEWGSPSHSAGERVEEGPGHRRVWAPGPARFKPTLQLVSCQYSFISTI